MFEGMGHFKSKDGDSYVGQMKKHKYHGKVLIYSQRVK